MNLITKYKNLIFLADVPQPFKLLTCPYSSHRIMWITQNKQLYIMLFYFVFKIIKIYAIVSGTIVLQIAAYQLSIIFNYYVTEWIINRLLNNNCISFLCKGANCIGNSNTYTWSMYMPFWRNLPVMMSPHPTSNCFKKSISFLNV